LWERPTARNNHKGGTSLLGRGPLRKEAKEREESEICEQKRTKRNTILRQSITPFKGGGQLKRNVHRDPKGKETRNEAKFEEEFRLIDGEKKPARFLHQRSSYAHARGMNSMEYHAKKNAGVNFVGGGRKKTQRRQERLRKREDQHL